MRVAALLIFSSLFAVMATAQAAPAPQYSLQHEYVLGGDGGWDYLTYDAEGHRLFISRGDRIQVVDTGTGKLITEIPGMDGVHGAALVPELGKGFTSNGRSNSVTVFDFKTLKVTNTIKLSGEGPDGFVYEPVTKRVFFFNGHSKNVSVVDAVTEKEIAVIPLDGRPEFPVADGKGMVYVNIESKSELSEIDAAKAVVTKTWSLAPCESPSGLAMDQQHRRLFSGCDNKLMAVSDPDAGKVVATFPIGDGVDATRFDPGTQLAFSSNGEGTLTVAHEDSPDKYTVLQNAPTRKFARTMTLDPVSHQVYLVTAQVEVGPAPAPGQRPKRTVLPGTFKVLVMGQQ
ncbi:MAG TPA: YncE family protein [Gammaproteobacteria bacterium]|nr:YncE family protein [Gammaproteobacteria bacterium]